MDSRWLLKCILPFKCQLNLKKFNFLPENSTKSSSVMACHRHVRDLLFFHTQEHISPPTSQIHIYRSSLIGKNIPIDIWLFLQTCPTHTHQFATATNNDIRLPDKNTYLRIHAHTIRFRYYSNIRSSQCNEFSTVESTRSLHISIERQ